MLRVLSLHFRSVASVLTLFAAGPQSVCAAAVLPAWVPASSIAPIPTRDFPVSRGVNPTHIIPDNSNSPDVVGAFRFLCGPAGLNYDDAIVFPGQPGKSHLHQYYGRTLTASDTYQTVRASGTSTCSGPNNALNRSGYWMPAMLDGNGNAIRPNYETVYYKRYPKSAIECTDGRYSSGCEAIPTGLKMIAGRDMLNLASTVPRYTEWECTTANGSGGQAKDRSGNATFPTMAKALAICPANGKWQLTVGLEFPSCWDGHYIDSPDHRSHVGYPTFRVPPGSPVGAMTCPISKETRQRMKFMPTFRLFVGWSIMPGDDTSKWRLSSDMMVPNEPAGSTLHGDYFEGWDPQAKQEWTDNCIDRMASCTSGNLGGGHILTGVPPPPQGPVPNRLIPLSDIPQSLTKVAS